MDAQSHSEGTDYLTIRITRKVTVTSKGKLGLLNYFIVNKASFLFVY